MEHTTITKPLLLLAFAAATGVPVLARVSSRKRKRPLLEPRTLRASSDFGIYCGHLARRPLSRPILHASDQRPDYFRGFGVLRVEADTVLESLVPCSRCRSLQKLNSESAADDYLMTETPPNTRSLAYINARTHASFLIIIITNKQF